MGSLDPNSIEASMREAQTIAQPQAKKFGVVLRGAFATNDATIDTDGDGTFETFNPDTGAGSEPGNNFIHCFSGDGKSVLWTVTEAHVKKWGYTSGLSLASRLSTMLLTHPGAEHAE